MRITFALTILLYSGSIWGQTSYDDVAVIVNMNSQESIDIGTFFKSERNIPDVNMIYVYTSTDEDIDSITFNSLRFQVENHLVNNDMVDSINYLVTTKGVPLSVNRGCVLDQTVNNTCASVDSELALILGPMSAAIGAIASVTNPYFESHNHFSRANEGVYLVTRLDGYSVADVYRLIDNSGPQIGINQIAGQSIVDISNAVGSDVTYFTNLYTPAYDSLLAGGWNATFDNDTLPLVNQNNVIGYFGLGHGPLSSATFNYEWTKGAVGSMSMCNSAFTFDQATNTNNAVLLADLIADGCTGAIGHVDYIYFSQIIPIEIFIDRYYNSGMNFNLAESFYMTERGLSWQTVVIGDPKASVFVDNLANVSEPLQSEFNIYPNPSTGIVHVSTDQEIIELHVFDMSGKAVAIRTQEVNNKMTLDFSNVQSGVFLVQVETDKGMHPERVVIQH